MKKLSKPTTPYTLSDYEQQRQFADFMSYFLEFKDYVDGYELHGYKEIPLTVLGLAAALKTHIHKTHHTLDSDIHEAMTTLCSMMENYVTHRCMSLPGTPE